MLLIIYLCPIPTQKKLTCGWLFSQSASNFGTLLSGIGTVALAALGLYAAFSWKRWKDEKRREKKSNLAEQLLMELDLFETLINEWLKHILQVYSQDSKANIKQLESLPNDYKLALHKRMQADLFELKNYYKQGDKLRNSLNRLKVPSESLDKEVPVLVEKLDAFISTKLYSLNIWHLIDATKEQKVKAYGNLSVANIDEFKTTIALIREKLKPHIFFEN